MASEMFAAPLGRVWDFLRRLFGGGAADPLVGFEPEHTRLIVGLGNPGPEFADTRHNLGFQCVEKLARDNATTWRDRKQDLHSLVAVIRPEDDMTVVLAKPLTFMNRSGVAVHALLAQLNLEPDRCLVIYDDMDLPFGSLRLRERGSPGTHNGMRSVIASLASDAIPRLRIGISKASPGEATSHVLSEFAPEERDAVDGLVARAAAAALAWALHGAGVAMNRYNKS